VTSLQPWAHGVMIGGAKGLRTGVGDVFGGHVLIQRCQWPKRKSVVRHGVRAEQKSWGQ
jgi:hypothetical protein